MFTRTDDKISTRQTAIFITDSVLGAGILTLPRSVIESAQTPDVWLSVLVGGFIVLMVSLVMVKLSQQFPNNTVYQYAKRIVGTVPGGMLSVCLIIYFIVIAGFEVRVFAEVTIYFLLEGTPIWAIVIPFIWVGAYICLGGINSIARVFQIIFPISILILVLSYFLSIRLFEIDNLRPVLSEGLLPVFKGLKSTVLVFTGCEVIMILVAHMQHPERAVKATFAGIGIPLVLYLMTVVVVIGGMSIDSVMNSTWPTIDLLRSFEIAGLIFERFEFPFLVIWMMQLFCNFTSFYYHASLGISQVFGVRILPVIFGLIPAIFITALLPERINEVFKLGDSIGMMGIAIFFLVPVLLSVIFLFRKKVLKHHV
ncbi:GerAB/ArcD/ProY family transporter [Paenibacillus paridis]|uniref:GerAB/ArcD/ProY family transporter n=1 Tax=Paenibacillus paridis TaxID=2583376 RepID=UPI0011246C8E|nr:GerAB/ArcD/ProY family transporter [Paenibacillus paridis]